MCYFVHEGDDYELSEEYRDETSAEPQHCVVCGGTISPGEPFDRWAWWETEPEPPAGLSDEEFDAWSDDDDKWGPPDVQAEMHPDCHKLAEGIQLDACEQELYIVHGLDLDHDVEEHHATHPHFKVEWERIKARRDAQGTE